MYAKARYGSLSVIGKIFFVFLVGFFFFFGSLYVLSKFL